MASAADPYDGVWVVSIMTEKGACPQELMWDVTVVNGAVTRDGRTMGKVGGSGSVHLRLELGSEALIASGSVKGSSGSGFWQDSSKQCSGHWTALKS